MNNKLFYLNKKEAQFLRSVISFQLKRYDVPQKETKGREYLKNVLIRLHKFLRDNKQRGKR